MPHGSREREVLQLAIGEDAPQHQPAAAHVAPADEIHRKQEPIAENRQQHLDVLSRRDAAEQHDIALGPGSSIQRARGPDQRIPIPRITEIDRLGGKRADRVEGDHRLGRPQAGVWRDH